MVTKILCWSVRLLLTETISEHFPTRTILWKSIMPTGMGWVVTERMARYWSSSLNSSPWTLNAAKVTHRQTEELLKLALRCLCFRTRFPVALRIATLASQSRNTAMTFLRTAHGHSNCACDVGIILRCDTHMNLTWHWLGWNAQRALAWILFCQWSIWFRANIVVKSIMPKNGNLKVFVALKQLTQPFSFKVPHMTRIKQTRMKIHGTTWTPARHSQSWQTRSLRCLCFFLLEPP